MRWAPLGVASLVLCASTAAAQQIYITPTTPAPTVAPVVTPPRILEDAQPVYPPEALAAGLTAQVTLELSVGEDGRVKDKKVSVPAAPGHGFDEAALEAATRLRFHAGTVNGKPAASQVTFTFHFTVEESAQAVTGGAEPPVRLSGAIKERGTRAALAGARVDVLALDGTPIADAEADAEGRFSLRILSLGKVHVVVTLSRYKTLKLDENLPETAALEVTYRLGREGENKYASTVRGEHAREEVARIPLSKEEIEHIPGTHGDALRAVTNLPGIARAPFDAGQLVIWGSAPSDSSVFLNGMYFPGGQIFHFGGLTSVFNSEFLNAVEYQPGNFGVRYGRATGGIIDLIPRAGSREGFHGYAKIDFIDAGIKLEGPIGKGSFGVALRRSMIDLGLAVAGKIAPISFVLSPTYWDYQAVLDYPLFGGNIKLVLFGSDDQFKLILKNVDQDSGLQGAFDNHSFFHTFNAYYTRRWKRFELFASLSTGPQYAQLQIGYGVGFQQTAFEFDGRIEGKLILDETLSIVGGIDVATDWSTTHAVAPYLATEAQVQAPLGSLPKKDFTETGVGWSPAAYIEARVNLWKRLKITPGFRFDKFDGVREPTFDPRLAVRFDLTPQVTLKGGIGLYHQAPVAPYSDAYLGNPNLHSEQAIHTSVGIELGSFAKLPAVKASLTGFYKDLRYLVSASDAMVQRNGKVVPEVYDDHGIGRIYGLEVLLRRDFAPWFYGWVAYTLLKSERQDEPGQPWRPFQYDQTHILTVVGTLRLPWDVTVGARFRYSTGNPDTPYAGSIFSSDCDCYLPITGTPYSRRLPDFNQLDLRVDKKIVFSVWTLVLYLDVENVYNQKNVEAYAQSFDYNDRNKTTVTGLPIIPSIGVKGEF